MVAGKRCINRRFPLYNTNTMNIHMKFNLEIEPYTLMFLHFYLDMKNFSGQLRRKKNTLSAHIFYKRLKRILRFVEQIVWPTN